MISDNYCLCSQSDKQEAHIHTNNISETHTCRSERAHTCTHLSDKTALHQGSLLTSLRPAKSRSKILLLLMPAGSPVNGTACAYTWCVIKQARTVMVDKEGHFICGSSLILMKPVIYDGTLTFYRQQWLYTSHHETDAVSQQRSRVHSALDADDSK